MAQSQLGVLMGLTAGIGLSAGDAKPSARTVGPFFLCLEVTALYGSCNGETVVPVRNTITLPWPHLRKILTKTQDLFSCHIHSRCRMGPEMQIEEHLHLCAVGVTKSFGVVGSAPPFMGTWNGGSSISMAVPKVSRLKAMFGGGGYKKCLKGRL